jgi:serine/threonine protein phosphatase 1
MNIYAFGDIHGEIHKLQKLIHRLNINKKDDELVFLGDYIDRGNYTYEVIDYLVFLNKHYNCVFLMGNHESMLIDYMIGIYENIFLQNGGSKTIKSYEKHGYDLSKYSDYTERFMPSKHWKFFLDLKYYYETEDYIFVHAGIDPKVPMKKQLLETILWGRQFSFINYTGKTVVYGHYPSNHITNEKYKICIDTGACFDSMGDLTCVKLPEREFTRQNFVMEDIMDA